MMKKIMTLRKKTVRLETELEDKREEKGKKKSEKSVKSVIPIDEKMARQKYLHFKL